VHVVDRVVNIDEIDDVDRMEYVLFYACLCLQWR